MSALPGPTVYSKLSSSRWPLVGTCPPAPGPGEPEWDWEGLGGRWSSPGRWEASLRELGGGSGGRPPDKGPRRHRRCLCSRAAAAAAHPVAVPVPAGAPTARDPLGTTPPCPVPAPPVTGRGLGCAPSPRRPGMLPPRLGGPCPPLPRGYRGPPAHRDGRVPFPPSPPPRAAMGAGVPSRVPRGCRGSPSRRGRGAAWRGVAGGGAGAAGLLQGCGGGRRLAAGRR